jgi:hypothetical protein
MSSNASSSGISGTTALQIVFIVLRLTHNIMWSWWWVMSPTWIMSGLALIFLAILFIISKQEEKKMNKRFKGDGKWNARLQEFQKSKSTAK